MDFLELRPLAVSPDKTIHERRLNIIFAKRTQNERRLLSVASRLCGQDSTMSFRSSRLALKTDSIAILRSGIWPSGNVWFDRRRQLRIDHNMSTTHGRLSSLTSICRQLYYSSTNTPLYRHTDLPRILTPFFSSSSQRPLFTTFDRQPPLRPFSQAPSRPACS